MRQITTITNPWPQWRLKHSGHRAILRPLRQVQGKPFGSQRPCGRRESVELEPKARVVEGFVSQFMWQGPLPADIPRAF